jgi:hypothetical protein
MQLDEVSCDAFECQRQQPLEANAEFVRDSLRGREAGGFPVEAKTGPHCATRGVSHPEETTRLHLPLPAVR